MRGGDRSSTHPEPPRSIRVRGAREHNLKGVDVDIPRDRLVVVTGLSGSGKSSLAFDTVFAEGQRKYMESLSAYARQFLDTMRKPDIDDIEGLPPTIAIEQRSGIATPRSTVATSTEIYDYLRLLFARCGDPVCWAPTKAKRGFVVERCGLPIHASSASQIVKSLVENLAGRRAMLLAPVVRGKKGFHKEAVERLQQEGYARIRVNGEVLDIRDALKEGGDNPMGLGRYERHDILAVVDRVVINQSGRQRLAESVETALALGKGTLVIASQKDKESTWEDQALSERFACEVHPECSIDELEPRLFSFNSPYGACSVCNGLGVVPEFDEALVVPDASRSLADGAIKPWHMRGAVKHVWRKRLRAFCTSYGVDMHTPLDAMRKDQRELLLYGDGTDIAAKKHTKKTPWPGVMGLLQQWWEQTESDKVREWLGGFQQPHECPACFGDRLNIKALSVFIRTSEPLPERIVDLRRRHGLTDDPKRCNIADVARMTISEAVCLIGSIQLSDERNTIAEPILREIQNRLGFLQSVGLAYLSLNRKVGSLSGGEAQRIRLASQVGSKLVGACYVLDEPTIGLHQRDNSRLIGTLRSLADIGNTVLVVEHDEDMIRAADHVLDIGPGPGVHGGRVVAQGTVQEIVANKESLTGDYLSGRKRIEVPAKRRDADPKKAVVVKGARQHNLKGADAVFPLGAFTCVTGVSGSGKSTLVNDILLKAAQREITGTRVAPGAHTRVNGLGKVTRVVQVDQSPIGRTPRSNPATYTGAFDEIRKLFARTKEAKVRGYQAGRFSFNVKGGRCEACQGQGVKKIEMHFLPDVFVDCEVCKGARYNRETLEITHKGKSVADVLGMTIEEACAFFENQPKIFRIVSCLRDVGLGYVKLGQPSPTLSGGEAQRVKLAAELYKSNTATGEPIGGALFVLDEPTTGLHFQDIQKLLEVLQRLASAGNTLVVIEHNLDVVKCADWIVDLGPEGGQGGGTIVAEGTPETVAACKGSHTGAYLAPMLKVERENSATEHAQAKDAPKRAGNKAVKKTAKKQRRRKATASKAKPNA